MSNAYKSLEYYLGENWHIDDDKLLMNQTYHYLNDNFVFKKNGTKFNLVIVASINIFYFSRDLFIYTKSGNNRTVVVCSGEICYRCDEDIRYEEYLEKFIDNTQLTCFKFGDLNIAYEGENVEFISSIDSHSY